MKFTVTMSARGYAVKPSNWGSVTNHMKAQQPRTVSYAEFLQRMREGFMWCGACHDLGRWGEAGFVSQQLFGVDVDNAAEGEGKRPLTPDDEGYLAPLQAIRRCALLKSDIEALCMYSTFNCSDEWPRYRIVFALPEPVTEWADASAVLDFLLAEFSEGDAQCCNPNRLFAGSTAGGVVPLWGLL